MSCLISYIRLDKKICTYLYALRCHHEEIQYLKETHHEEMQYLKAVQVILTSAMPQFLTVQTYKLINILNIVSCNPLAFPTFGKVLHCFWFSGTASKKNVQRREEQALS